MAEGYRVIGQQQRTTLGPDGRFQDVVEVTFTTDHGVTQSVTVPLVKYNADTVKAMIDERLSHIDAVHNL